MYAGTDLLSYNLFSIDHSIISSGKGCIVTELLSPSLPPCGVEQWIDILHLTAVCLTVCCRSAFLSAAKHFVEKDLEVSMAGRVFMITGANSGIGRATAMAIAKRGTVCGCRGERVGGCKCE